MEWDGRGAGGRPCYLSSQNGMHVKQQSSAWIRFVIPTSRQSSMVKEVSQWSDAEIEARTGINDAVVLNNDEERRTARSTIWNLLGFVS